jgi:hypothetical protein
MGEDPSEAARSELRGIERDEWIEEQVDQLRIDFFAALALGDIDNAHEHVERFETSMSRLPPRLRDMVISETTVMLNDELKAIAEQNGTDLKDSARIAQAINGHIDETAKGTPCGPTEDNETTRSR